MFSGLFVAPHSADDSVGEVAFVGSSGFSSGFAFAGYPALRVSGWSDGVEERPVGLAGVEECPDPVVGEVGEPERDTL